MKLIGPANIGLMGSRSGRISKDGVGGYIGTKITASIVTNLGTFLHQL